MVLKEILNMEGHNPRSKSRRKGNPRRRNKLNKSRKGGLACYAKPSVGLEGRGSRSPDKGKGRMLRKVGR